MISYAEDGNPSPHPQYFVCGPSWHSLTQHWVQGATLGPPDTAPLASLDLPEAEGPLVFRARMIPSAIDQIRTRQREFVSGLWKRNVVEWFIGNPRNGRYIEVHLAPSHQWWASTFLAVRQPVHPDGHPLPLSRVIHRTAAGATSWEGEVRVPAQVVTQLLDAPSLDGLRTNFSAVWFPPGGHACYYSLAPLHGPKPNFHQPDLWLPLHIP